MVPDIILFRYSVTQGGAGQYALLKTFGVFVPGTYQASDLRTAMRYTMVYSTLRTATKGRRKFGDVEGSGVFAEGGNLPMRVVFRSRADVHKRVWHRRDNS